MTSAEESSAVAISAQEDTEEKASENENQEQVDDTKEAENVDLDNFTNESALMIAYERAIETESEEPLISDPYARRLAGTKGEALSATFGENGHYFGFPDWPEFHKTWTVVRTKFIDDKIGALINEAHDAPLQFVNLGAGLDTRALRLDCLKDAQGSWEVDMEVINSFKAQVFANMPDAASVCPQHIVSADLLNATGLESALAAEDFDKTIASVIVAEGLIMYLPGKEEQLLQAVSGIAASGSTLILNFLDAGAHGISAERLQEILEVEGWTQFEVNQFGDEVLDYGRFNKSFAPSASFSFLVCKKDSA